MTASLLLMSTSALLAGLSSNLGMLSAACILYGASDCMWGISRHNWVTSIVSMENRGKVLSPLGGLGNFSNFIGPIIGGLVSNYLETRYGFFIQLGLCLTVLAIVRFIPRKDPTEDEEVGKPLVQADVEDNDDSSAGSIEEEELTLSKKAEKGCKTTCSALLDVVQLQIQIMRDNAWNLFTVGTYCMFLSIVRSARVLIIPLIALSIGLSKTNVGLMTAISFGINTLFCSIGGYVIDRHGRRFSGILAIFIMAFAFVHLPFTTTIPPGLNNSTITTSNTTIIGANETHINGTDPTPLSIGGLVITAVITGIGNSFGSGLVLTMGADVAPKVNRAEFLGIFRLAVNFGSVVGPLILGLLMDHTPLAGSCGFIFAMGICGALWMFFFVTETLVRKDDKIEEVVVPEESEDKDSANDVELSKGTDTSDEARPDKFQKLKELLVQDHLRDHTTKPT